MGHEGEGWNILHFAVKINALECIEFILKSQYEQSSDEYNKLVNSKTVEGYTPLMIAIISESNDALMTLLKYGGINIRTKDNKKRTSYELAINYKN